MNLECLVLIVGSVILGTGLYLALPKPVPGEHRTLRWIGALMGLLGLLS